MITIDACCPSMMEALADGKFIIGYDHFRNNEYETHKMCIRGTPESRYCPYCGTPINIELSIRGESYDGSLRFNSEYRNRFKDPEYISKADKGKRKLCLRT